MKRFGKRFLLLLMGILLPLLLLEGGLQVAAYWTYLQSKAGEVAPLATERRADERVVLCVGDSFTYGSGSSSRKTAYPAQLARHLHQAASDEENRLTWHVINRGWPGWNSSEVLQRLPAMLKEAKPDYLCILIGNNNLWSDAEMNLPLPQLETGQGKNAAWQWKCRTKRLLALGTSKLLQKKPKSEEREEEKRKGPETGLKTAPPSKKKAPPSQDPERRLPEYHALLRAERLVRDQKFGEANLILEEVRPVVRKSTNRALAQKYLLILYGLRRHQEVVDQALFDLEKYGRSTEVNLLIVEPLARLGRLEEALAYANEALEIETAGPIRAAFLNNRALVYKLMKNYPMMLKDYFLAFDENRDEVSLESNILKLPKLDRLTQNAIPDILNTLSLRPEVREKILLVLGRAMAKRRKRWEGSGALMGSRSGAMKKLEVDLAHMTLLANQSGAKVVLLTYPEAIRDVDESLRRFARQAGIPLADSVGLFQERLHTANREDYFIADGHCNDAGYALVAERVAKILLALEK